MLCRSCKMLNLLSVTGYYMYIETSSPRQLGDNAKLHSPKLLFRGHSCLQFYYHMYGADMGTFNVTINGSTYFYASGNKGDMWLEAKVDVKLWGAYVVRKQFMATVMADKIL